jgi:hypothetical protein
MDYGELSASISYHAAAAIRLDSQHSYALAIKHYQYAVYAIQELVYSHSSYKIQKIYIERANAYENRIKALRMMSCN